MGEYAAPADRLDASGMRLAIIAGRFNGHVTTPLLDGALATLADLGLDRDDVAVYWVPGAFEIPVLAKRLALTGTLDAVVCLGAVIRGDTPHFDYVAGHAAGGLAQVQSESGIPIAFGVLTTNTVEQAVDRAGAKSGNKGFDAALTAIEMCNLLRQIRASD